MAMTPSREQMSTLPSREIERKERALGLLNELSVQQTGCSELCTRKSIDDENHSQGKDVPGTSSSADDGDGGAGNANEGSDVLNDDAQETKELGNGGIGRSAGAVAALEATSSALVSRGSCGGSKGSGGRENSEGLELHV